MYIIYFPKVARKIYMRVKVAVPISQDKDLWLAGSWNPNQSESCICHDVGPAAVIPHAATFTLWCCPVFRVWNTTFQIVTWLFRNVLTNLNFEPWQPEQKRGSDRKIFQILLSLIKLVLYFDDVYAQSKLDYILIVHTYQSLHVSENVWAPLHIFSEHICKCCRTENGALLHCKPCKLRNGCVWEMNVNWSLLQNHPQRYEKPVSH
jgi:hypothetical protein